MKPAKLATFAALTCVLVGIITSAHAAETNKWKFDVMLYGLASSMDGEITVKGVSADLQVGFDDILENLEMGAMGKIRVGYNRWAFSTEIIYMGLGASKGSFAADFDQWIVEPSVGYTVCKNFEALVGVRYNNLNAVIGGPFPIVTSGTQDWWDPIIGANLSLPFAKKFSFNVRGDVGGFGVGSDLTWQAFPYLSWRFAEWGSAQAGFRWVYVDYETGSGASSFRYDMLTQGPQFGATLHF